MDTPSFHTSTRTTDLFTKIGPLPAWAWGALVVGGYLVWNHLYGTPAVVDDGSSTADQGDLGNDGSAVDLSTPDSSTDAGYNYGDVNAGDYGGTSGGTVFTSNQAWAVYVIGALTKMGYPASTVTTAITYYLAGKALTTKEAQIVTAGIADFGPPPLPMPVKLVPSSSGAAPTAPKLAGATTADHKVSLSWSKVTGAATYAVFRDSTMVTFTRGTKFTSGTFKPGTKHTWRVRAVGTNGKTSAYSNSVVVTVK